MDIRLLEQNSKKKIVAITSYIKYTINSCNGILFY